MSHIKRGKTKHFTHNVIKKVMQTDDNVGRITRTTSSHTAIVADVFIRDLTLAAMNEAKQNGRIKITEKDVLACLEKYEKFDFIEVNR